MFNQLPHEMNREIGSFLDYNSRINFFRVLPDREDKFVRKLESDAHNLAVKRELIKSCSDIVYAASTRRKKAIFMAKMFRYLAKTKDTCLLDAVHSTSFKNVVIEKAKFYSNPECQDYANLFSARAKQELINASKLLLARWTTHVPKKEFPRRFGFVEII